MIDLFETCQCHCHDPNMQVMHIMPCCFYCDYCEKNIKFDYEQNHQHKKEIPKCEICGTELSILNGELICEKLCRPGEKERFAEFIKKFHANKK